MAVCQHCFTEMSESDINCPICNMTNPTYINIDDKIIIEQIHDEYGLDQNIIKMLIATGFVQNVDDNCIIYMNGIVDSYKDAAQMLECLTNNEGMSEMHIDIQCIIVNGIITDFELYSKVGLYVVEENTSTLSNDNLSNYIIILDNNEVRQFNDAKDLCEFIDVNDEPVDKIFIKKVLHDYNKTEFIKVGQVELEIEPGVPF